MAEFLLGYTLAGRRLGWSARHVRTLHAATGSSWSFFLILKDFIEISNTRYRNEAVVAPNVCFVELDGHDKVPSD